MTRLLILAVLGYLTGFFIIGPLMKPTEKSTLPSTTTVETARPSCQKLNAGYPCLPR